MLAYIKIKNICERQHELCPVEREWTSRSDAREDGICHLV